MFFLFGFNTNVDSFTSKLFGSTSTNAIFPTVPTAENKISFI